MALPAVQEGNQDLSMVVGEIKDLVDGVVENLTAIKITQMDMARGIGDLVAKAELDFEQMADAEAESLDAEVVDAEAASVMDSNDGTVIDLLMEIKDAVKETAEYTKVSADADKEASENVLKDGIGDSVDREGSQAAEGGDKAAKAVKEQSSFIQKLFGGLLGLFSGLFIGWLKALKMVFYRGFIARIGAFFGNFFKSLKTTFSGGKLAAGFARIGNFFKSIGAFFGRIFKIFKPVVQFFKTIIGIAGRILGVLSKIFAPLLIIFGIFESIRGFFQGFAESEGNFFQKLMDGLAGALTGFLDFLIAAPLNLIKGIIGWIAGALGFEGVKEKLESFDFSFGSIIKAVFDVIGFVAGIAFKILKFPVALAAGIAGGIAALLPGGKSPKEGFMDAFNAVMNFGSGEGKAPIPKEDSADAETMSAESTAADDGDKVEEEPTETVEGPSDSGETKASIFPFKIKGMKKFGRVHDEYTITGKEYTGDGRSGKSIYTGRTPLGMPANFTEIDEKQYISDAVEGRRSIMEMSRGPGEMDMSLQGITGTGLQTRSAELQAQRDAYAGGFKSGPQAFVNTTNAPTSTVSTTTITQVKDSDNSIKGRYGRGSL